MDVISRLRQDFSKGKDNFEKKGQVMAKFTIFRARHLPLIDKGVLLCTIHAASCYRHRKREGMKNTLQNRQKKAGNNLLCSTEPRCTQLQPPQIMCYLLIFHRFVLY